MTPPLAGASPLATATRRQRQDWASDGPIKPVLATRMRRRPPGSAAERMRAGTIAGGSGCERGRACPRAARSDRHFLVDLVWQSRSDGGVGGRFYFAPVRQGGSNRRDADVAITTIEICIEISPTATGCFLRLGRIVLGHCSSPSNSQFCCRLVGAPGSLGGTVGWRASAAEMRNKSCRSMTFQTVVLTRGPARFRASRHGRSWVNRGLRHRRPLRMLQGRQLFTARGPNCGIPATGSEDYRIQATAALELASPFGLAKETWGTQRTV
jgi:hypothetical protein